MYLDEVWRIAFENGTDTAMDLHERFGIDTSSELMRERSFRWLERRIVDVATRGPSRVSDRLIRKLAPAREPDLLGV